MFSIFYQVFQVKLSKTVLYNDIVLKHFPEEDMFKKQSYPQCAQFFVHKDRIMSRPKSFYEHCFKLCTDTDYLLSKKANTNVYTTRTVTGFFFEANWHYIFGEEYLYNPYYKYYNDYPFKGSFI